MKRLLLLLSMVALTAVVGCDDFFPPDPGDGDPKPPVYRNIEWILESYQTADGKVVKVNRNNPWILFDDKGTANGFGGCNKYWADYTADSVSMKIENLVATKIACPYDEQIESLYFQGLNFTDTYKVTQTSLHLYVKYPPTVFVQHDVMVLNFVKTVPPPDPVPAREIVYNEYPGNNDNYNLVNISSNGSGHRVVGEGVLSSYPRNSRMSFWYNEPGIWYNPSVKTSGTDGSNVLMSFSGDNTMQLVRNSVAIAPGGKRVAYGVKDPRLMPPIVFQQLRVANTDGSNQVKIADNMQHESTPAFSPDGEYVAFYGSDGKVYIASTNGNETPRAVADNGSPTVFSEGYDWLEWSPDGVQIAFIGRGVNNMSTDLYVVNAFGRGLPANLTMDASTELWPVWSPDGSRIAFSSSLPLNNSVEKGEFHIYSINLLTMGPTPAKKERLTPPSMLTVVQHELFPQWSLDGKQVLFSRFYQLPTEGGEGQLELVTVADKSLNVIAKRAYKGFFAR